MRNSDFIGKAEEIKSHELSVKETIKELKESIEQEKGTRRRLKREIWSLEAAIAAAYEDTDEDGWPDYGRISQLESQKDACENQLSEVEENMEEDSLSLENSQSELSEINEDKARTLQEIEDRARKTQDNISYTNDTCGAYAVIGDGLREQLQNSLVVLSQAAGILGGSVPGTASGGGGSGTGVSPGSGAGGSYSRSLTAVQNANAGEEVGYTPTSAAKFTSGQEGLTTPASRNSFAGGHTSASLIVEGAKKFTSNQNPNDMAAASFDTENTAGRPQQNPDAADEKRFRSSQSSAELAGKFMRDKHTDTGVDANESPAGHLFSVESENNFRDRKDVNVSDFEKTHPRGAQFRKEFREKYRTSEQILSEGSKEDLRDFVMKEQLANEVDFGELDVRVAGDLVRVVRDAKQKFPFLKMDFIGSTEALNRKIEIQLYENMKNLISRNHPDMKNESLISYLAENSARGYMKKYREPDFFDYAYSYHTGKPEEMLWPEKWDEMQEDYVDQVYAGITASLHGISINEEKAAAASTLLRRYMYENNYSEEDYDTYSEDQEWQRLHNAAYPQVSAGNGEKEGGYEHLSRLLDADTTVGWHPHGCDTPEYLAWHEISHQLDFVLKVSEDPQVVREYESFIEKSKKIQKASLCLYAAENVQEFVAEAYAEYRMNPHPRKIAQLIGRIIEEKAEQFRKGGVSSGIQRERERIFPE